MARKLRNNYNIDLLRLCYKQPDGLFEDIAETKPKTNIPREGYYLHILGEEDENSPKSVACEIVTDDGIKVGNMVFNEASSKYGKLCFFRFENAALYNDYISRRGSLIYCIDYIAEDLGLKFISVTELHIANDSNINKIAKILRLRRDDNYDLVVNRKRIGKGKKLPNALKNSQMTRERDVNPSIRIEQKKKEAPKVVMYNKTVEINEESGKEYITRWNEFGRQTIYRSELRLKWEYLKEYFEEKGIKGYGVFNAILNPRTLEEIFEHFTSRLIYFRDKRTDEIVTIYNIA